MRVPVETVPRARLDAQARTESPQGVLALARPLEPVRARGPGRARPPRHRAVPAGGGRHHRPAQPGRAPAQRRVRRRDRRRAAAPPLGPAVAHGDQDGGRGHRAPALRRRGRRARPRSASCATSACGRSAWPARRTSRSTTCRSARARWRWSSAARRRGWRRWCAGAAMRWPPSPSTARCPRSTSAWPARSPASRWPASGRQRRTRLIRSPLTVDAGSHLGGAEGAAPRRDGDVARGTRGTRASRAWAPRWAARSAGASAR